MPMIYARSLSAVAFAAGLVLAGVVTAAADTQGFPTTRVGSNSASRRAPETTLRVTAGRRADAQPSPSDQPKPAAEQTDAPREHQPPAKATSQTARTKTQEQPTDKATTGAVQAADYQQATDPHGEFAPQIDPTAGVVACSLLGPAACGEPCGCGDVMCGGALGCGGLICPPPGPAYRVFGEYLYWRASGTEVAYASELTDRGLPIGPTATADAGYASGFRVGFDVPLSPTCWVRASYTDYEATGGSALSSSDTSTREVFSLVTHPISFDASVFGFEASGNLGIDLDIVDVDLMGLAPSPATGLPLRFTYLLGVRYAGFDQDFQSLQPALTGATVDPLRRELNAQVDFRGVGPRFGLGVESPSFYAPLFLYANTSASFLAGRAEGRYEQVAQGALAEAFNTWDETRLTPVLDFELGVGFCCGPGAATGATRVTLGYVASYWLNTVTTDEFIVATQRFDYTGMGETVTLDGLRLRAEFMY